MEAVFQDCIRTERDRGRTVLLSSHILSEVEALCDRVSIIRAGAVVETGTLAELRHLTRTSIEADTARPATDLATTPGVYDVVTIGSRVRFSVDTEQLSTVVGALAGHGLRGLTSSPPTLEELFLRHYSMREGGATGDSTIATESTGDSRGETTLYDAALDRSGADDHAARRANGSRS
jgi:ABC-2 type transport system ATP-binding protein